MRWSVSPRSYRDAIAFNRDDVQSPRSHRNATTVHAASVVSRNDPVALRTLRTYQGTGATVLAGVLGALRMKKREPEALRSLKVGPSLE